MEPPCQGKKRLKTCWKKVRLFQPGRHSVEDEVDGLVEDAGGLVELQLGLQVVVLTLHVHDHGVQELDLNKDLLKHFWKLFVRSLFSLDMPLESHP